MKVNKINKAHPELREGEIFLTNASDFRRGAVIISSFGQRAHVDHRSDWESIGWRTKRRGVIAYDVYDKPINGMFPVFVQREELVKGGINPDALWN